MSSYVIDINCLGHKSISILLNFIKRGSSALKGTHITIWELICQELKVMSLTPIPNSLA